ncbi:MAG: hypothetical protein ABIH09_02055 [Candidatus Omnitrophota bacterium]
MTKIKDVIERTLRGCWSGLRKGWAEIYSEDGHRPNFRNLAEKVYEELFRSVPASEKEKLCSNCAIEDVCGEISENAKSCLTWERKEKLCSNCGNKHICRITLISNVTGCKDDWIPLKKKPEPLAKIEKLKDIALYVSKALERKELGTYTLSIITDIVCKINEIITEYEKLRRNNA